MRTLVAFLIIICSTVVFAQSYTNYQVKTGDTLFDVALQFETTVSKIKEINTLYDSTIYVGQVLKLPASSSAQPVLSSFAERITKHVVTADETLADISEKYNISIESLKKSNPELVDLIEASPLVISTQILIPPAEGILISFSDSDNILSLALKNGLKPVDLLDANGLTSVSEVVIGQVLYIPDRSVVALTNNPFRGIGGSDKEEEESFSSNISTATYSWPLSGRLTSAFGRRNISVGGNTFHKGIDIAAPSGTPIHAAQSARVSFSDWSNTYGWVIFLEHDDGSQTRYAHMSAMAVVAGDYVEQGQIIGYVGSTGASTGPHLHFEIRINKTPVNPMSYLPQ